MCQLTHTHSRVVPVITYVASLEQVFFFPPRFANEVVRDLRSTAVQRVADVRAAGFRSRAASVDVPARIWRPTLFLIYPRDARA